MRTRKERSLRLALMGSRPEVERRRRGIGNWSLATM